MENKSHAIAAGIFVVTVAALLLVLAVWLTRDQGSYQTYEMTTRQAVTGLQLQAPVRYKGVSVGKVMHIGFDPEQAGNVLIRVSVDETTPVTPRTFATLGYQGVTGLAYIDLDDADADLPLLGHTAKGHARIHMRPSSLSQLAAMGPEVIGDVRETMASINALLNAENRDTLAQTIERFGQAAHDGSVLMQNMNQGWSQTLEPGIARLTQDVGTSLQSLQRTAASIEQMSQEITRIASRLNAEDGALVQLNRGVQAFVGVAESINHGTLPRLERTMNDVSVSMQSVEQLTRNISSNPQAFLYGNPLDLPGPGERGYVAP